jgi:hypothetical protein
MFGKEALACRLEYDLCVADVLIFLDGGLLCASGLAIGCLMVGRPDLAMRVVGDEKRASFAL